MGYDDDESKANGGNNGNDFDSGSELDRVSEPDRGSELDHATIFVPRWKSDSYVPSYKCLSALDVESDESRDFDLYGDLAALFHAEKDTTSYVGLFHEDDYLIVDTSFDKYGNTYVYKYIRTETLDSYGRRQRPHLDQVTSLDLGLASIERISQIMAPFALATGTPVDLTHTDTPSVREWLRKKCDDQQQGLDDLEVLTAAMDTQAPPIKTALETYLDGCRWYPSDACIMRRDVLQIFCGWARPVMEAIATRCGTSSRGDVHREAIERFGAHLLGVFVRQLETEEEHPVLELPEMTFADTRRHGPIEPAFGDAEVPILFACNETYAPYCAAAIQSVIKTSSRHHAYDIIILEGELSDDTKALFQKMVVHHANFRLRFVDASYYVRRYDLKRMPRAGEEPYFKLIVPEVLASFDKLICLDCDVIVESDIAELLSIDLHGKTIAAAVDIFSASEVNGGSPELAAYVKARLHFDDPLRCFGMGVLVIDNTRFRELFSMRYLFEFVEVCAFDYQDRDAINVLCKDRVMPLGQEWDFLIDHRHVHRSCMQKYAPGDLYEEYLKASENPKIIHFVGSGKPLAFTEWESADRFWSAFMKTPFYRRFREERRKRASEGAQSSVKGLLGFWARSLLPPETRRGRFVRRAYAAVRHGSRG